MGPIIFPWSLLTLLLFSFRGATRTVVSSGGSTFGSEFFNLLEKFLDERILGRSG